MKKNTFFGCAVFLLNICFSNKIPAQCDTCQIIPVIVPDPIATQYQGNYDRNYRKFATPEKKKMHSISVDFSRESIIYFYEKVFITDAGKGYQGINVNLVSFGTTMLPRQGHNNQIGLMISPTDANCKSDSTECNIINNSFNQSKTMHDRTPITNSCGSQTYHMYKENYFTVHAKGDPNNHTKHVHFKKDVIKFFYDYFKSYPDYTSLRFTFASYNIPNQACGQKTDKQITILITPAYKDGSVSFSAFLINLKNKYGFVSDQQVKDFLKTLNHGSLCPDICPDE